MAPSFEGRFFDGKSADAAPAVATFERGGLFVELPDRQFTWRYREIVVLDRREDECRLGAKSEPDAALVLPEEACDVLRGQAPDHHGPHVAGRRLAAAVAVMVLVAGAVAALLFVGVPAASGPMARATPKSFETRIGSNMAAQIQTVFRRCGSDEAAALIEPVLADMAAKGDVGFEIEFEFVRTNAPNAFALPGGQVMATSGLLDAVGEDQEAFLAVMAHELGHVRGRDGLRAFYRNAGLGMLLEIITGGSGLAQQAVLIGGQLTQLRHTRQQEAEADEAAYDIMARTGLDPAALARAFEAITRHVGVVASDDDDDRDLPNWLKTHPDTDERIASAKARKSKTQALPLTEEEWQVVSAACSRKDD
jgi:predicted Zn-dependent protease